MTATQEIADLRGVKPKATSVSGAAPLPVHLRILHVGPFVDGSTSLWRRNTLKELGHDVVSFDTTPFDRCCNRLLQSMRHRLCWGPGVAPLNARFLELATSSDFDLIWVERGFFFRPKTLASVRGGSRALLVNYNTDDPFGKVKHCWRLFVKSIPYYDVHFVARAQNVSEYRLHRAKKVERLGWAYNPRMHFPQSVTADERRRLGGEIGFIGDYEYERASWMYYLATHGLNIRVWGPNWHKCPFQHPNLKLELRPLWAEDYVKAICAFDITLGFLRKANRDLSSHRSIEVPACGGFFLAERTADHLELFNEGSEAEFFDSKEELLKKAQFYLQNPDKRRQISYGGRERCIRSGYSFERRLADRLNFIRTEFPHGRID